MANGASWIRGFLSGCFNQGLAHGVSGREHSGKMGRVTLTGTEGTGTKGGYNLGKNQLRENVGG